MRLRDLKREHFTAFGTMRSSGHGWMLYVFPVQGAVSHLGNSVDQPYEFPTSAEAVEFAQFYFPGAVVHVGQYSVEQMDELLDGQGVRANV
jgi:hypothetical protein